MGKNIEHEVAYYLVQPVIVTRDEDGDLGPGPKINAMEVGGKQLSGFHADFVAKLPEIKAQLAAQAANGGTGSIAVGGDDDEEPTGNRAARRNGSKTRRT